MLLIKSTLFILVCLIPKDFAILRISTIFIDDPHLPHSILFDNLRYSSSRLSLLRLREIGPARNRFPCRELLAQVFELGRSSFVSIVAKKKMVWRIRGLDW